MGDLIEFYVTCNPPLLPKGVKYVLGQLKESKIACIEILYEPAVPWFQCTVPKRRKDPLANFLTSLIYDILVRETGDFELDAQTGDIEIIAEDPMILSWGAFLQLKEGDLKEYEQYRYPDSFQRFESKAIWQKLRSIDAPESLNTRGLLQREGDFDWSTNAFKELLGCEVSFNLQDDILYLGSDDSASIDEAVRRLDSLFEYRKHGAPPPTHLILPPDDSSEWKLCLRPIARFRLATSTIIQTNAVTVKEDYKSLFAKGIISTYVFENRYGEEWGLPEYTPAEHAMLPPESFVDFANYTYPAKQSTSKPSVCVPVAESTLSEPVSQKTATIVADWVRETGEAHGFHGHGSPVLQSPDGAPTSGAHPIQDLGSTTESSQRWGVPNTIVRNIMDEENSEIGQQRNVQTIKDAPVQEEGFQERGAYGDSLGTATHRIAPPTDGSSVKSARTSTLPHSSAALADLVGLSIPITTDKGAPNGLVEHAAPESHEHFFQQLEPETSRNGQDIQECRHASHISDLLGTDNDDSLQALMAPMVPTSTPQPGFGGATAQREYRQTMSQRASRRDRVPRHPNAAGRVSPSPLPSAQRKSKIPVKSQSPAPSVRNTQETAAQQSINTGAGGSGPTNSSTVPSGSRLRGSWNTGLRGESFGRVALSPMMQNSIKKRIDFERALEGCFESMLRRARVIPGKVSMEIVFCRIVIENVDRDAVNLGRVDEYHQNFAPLRLLDELASFREGDFRWHSTLSLNGSDANRLREINWTSNPGREWQQNAIEVFYDFGCEDTTSNCRFILQVNAADFTHSFESQKFALSDLVFIHCPDRSWDLNACVKATDTAYFRDKYEDFANSLVESLVVPEDLSCGKPRLSFHKHERYRVSVERVRVRHVARYRDGHGGNTFLNVTMWQAMNMDWNYVEGSNRKTRDIKVEPSENDDTKGVANVWYEASMSSVRADKTFQENAGIEFGEVVEWEEKKLKEAGVFRDLYLPAIAMVKNMDQIGAGNDNGHNPFKGDILAGAEADIGSCQAGQLFRVFGGLYGLRARV